MPETINYSLPDMRDLLGYRNQRR